MFRFLFRFTAWWLLAGAFVAVVIDGIRSISATRLVLFTVQEGWAALHPASLANWQKLSADAAWKGAFDLLLASPLWATLGVLGLLFALLGRRRAATAIGYSARD